MAPKPEGRPNPAKPAGPVVDQETRALDLALAFLTYRDRTAYEVRAHLISRDCPESLVDQVVRRLAKSGTLNDAIYAQRFIEYGSERGRGPLRLRRELLDKGIERELADTELTDFFGEGREYSLAEQQAERLLRDRANRNWLFRSGTESDEPPQTSRPPQSELARVGRRLAAQGFNQSVIYEVLGRLRG